MVAPKKADKLLSFHPTRVDTIRAIIAGSPSISPHPTFASIEDELEEVKKLKQIAALRRRHLLAVLHATRALDVALKTFVEAHGLSPRPSTSLGASLNHIKNNAPGTLKSAFTMQQRFQNSIVTKRNTYMHVAGSYPANDYEIRMLLAEIEHCLSVVLALE